MQRSLTQLVSASNERSSSGEMKFDLKRVGIYREKDLTLVLLNFFASFTTDDQSNFNVSKRKLNFKKLTCCLEKEKRSKRVIEVYDYFQNNPSPKL